MEEGMSSEFCIQTPTRRSSGGGGSGTKCGRWNPTAEQVKVLTELFRAGLRTPTTDQIQKISNQLSFYGKIESKNVFYWFQNHKARERQKRRRVVSNSKDITALHLHRHQSSCIQHLDHYDQYLIPSLQDPPPTKYFSELNQASFNPDRGIETLQLFPLNSYDEPESEKKPRMYSNEFMENNATFAYAIVREIDHPPLDLRLSFF